MSTVPEAVGRRPAAPAAKSSTGFSAAPALRQRVERAWAVARWPLAVYAGSRVLYLILAVLDTRMRGWQLGWELSNWDGFWYLLLVHTGYPAQALHTQSTLGFMPLYPLLVFAVEKTLFISTVLAGAVVSTVTGGIATVLVGRLSARWWDEAAARRVVIFLCLFPGSIVFSMLYTEGLLIALVAGCLLALEHRRWATAGLLAGLSTAVGPIAVAIIPACAAAAWIHLRRHGWQDRSARRALLAPALAPLGIVSFGAFLWVWTGDPLASYTAQHDGWQESSTPLALIRTASHLFNELINIPSLQRPGINLNYPTGLLGGAFLAVGLLWLYRERRRVPAAALAWTLGVALLTVTSNSVPPNPRMLLAAFPVVAVYAARLTGRGFAWLIGSSTVLLVSMSLVTFVGTGLRP